MLFEAFKSIKKSVSGSPGFSIVDKFFTIALLSSTFFWCLHCIGYIDHLLKSKIVYNIGCDLHALNGKEMQPKIAVLIPVFNEDPKIVKNTVDAAKDINYKNFEIFLLDDSTESKICKQLVELATNSDIRYVHRESRRGYKAGAINDVIKHFDKHIKYILILDADHSPKPRIFNDIIPYLENNPSLTFIQTPQYFASNIGNPLSIAYSFQQHIFYKHICRGANVNNSALICGTNVIIRLDHLKEIDGMSERCLTEDLASSFNFHSDGYKSLYLDGIYTEGISPTSLSAYFTQHMRWAYGTITNLSEILATFYRNPGCLKPSQWWEYIILNGSWYFLGWTLLTWLTYPIAVITFGVQPLVLGPINISFILFLLIIGCQMFTNTRERNYKTRDIFLAQGLLFSAFPIYIRASIYALIGRKMDFKVTPKKDTDAVSFAQVSPQFIILIFLIISIIIGVWREFTGQITTHNVHFIICWAIYDVIILIFMAHFYIEDVKKARTC